MNKNRGFSEVNPVELKYVHVNYNESLLSYLSEQSLYVHLNFS